MQFLVNEVNHVGNIAMNSGKFLCENQKRTWKLSRKFYSFKHLKRNTIYQHYKHLHSRFTADDRADRPNTSFPKLYPSDDLILVDSSNRVAANPMSLQEPSQRCELYHLPLVEDEVAPLLPGQREEYEDTSEDGVSSSSNEHSFGTKMTRSSEVHGEDPRDEEDDA